MSGREGKAGFYLEFFSWGGHGDMGWCGVGTVIGE